MKRIRSSTKSNEWILTRMGPLFLFLTIFILFANTTFPNSVFAQGGGEIPNTVGNQVSNVLSVPTAIQIAIGGVGVLLIIVIFSWFTRRKKIRAESIASCQLFNQQLRETNQQLEKKVVQIKNELTQTKQALTQEVAKGIATEENAIAQIRQFHELFDNIEIGITRIDLNLKIVMVNLTQARMLGYSAEELIGQKCFSIFKKHDGLCPACPGMKGMTNRCPEKTDFEIITKNNKSVPCQVTSYPSLDSKGQATGFIMVMRNMSRAEKASRRLKEVNLELDIKRSALEEKSVVLDGILGQVENDKNRMKSHISSNMEKIVVPIIHILRERTDSQNQNFISLLDSCIKDITSPFINHLESNYSRLSLREIEICNMVKNGLSTKDIARTLSTSGETVRKQRLQIRKKLGLTGKDVNLAGFLRNL